MAKKMRKLITLCIALAMCISMMTVTAFAGNDKDKDKDKGNGNGNTGTGQTQVHIHFQGEGNVGGNKDSVTIIVGENQYTGSVQGSKLEIEMDSTDNGFDFGANESMEVGYKNNDTGETGTIILTHKEANGTNIDKEHDNGLNNFNGTVKQPEKPTEPEATQPTTEATQPTTEATQPTTEATQPTTEATEPTTEATQPTTEATEPTTEATEPTTEATEPTTEATEPTTEATEPTTEATEPTTEATEPTTEATEPPYVPPYVPPVVTPQPQPQHPVMMMNVDGQAGNDDLVEIDDGAVPLADVPKTGDISTLWMALSALSAGGIVLVNKKRK